MSDNQGYTIAYWDDTQMVQYLIWGTNFTNNYHLIYNAFSRYLSEGEKVEILEHVNGDVDDAVLDNRTSYWKRTLVEQGYVVLNEE